MGMPSTRLVLLVFFVSTIVFAGKAKTHAVGETKVEAYDGAADDFFASAGEDTASTDTELIIVTDYNENHVFEFDETKNSWFYVDIFDEDETKVYIPQGKNVEFNRDERQWYKVEGEKKTLITKKYYESGDYDNRKTKRD